MSDYTKAAVQVWIVILVSSAIGLSLMAALTPENTSNIPPDRPPCTNLNSCR